MAANYPPYVNAYGNIPKLFDAIKAASVPPKFTNDFMQTMLGLKSTSYRAMIPLLKRLGFLDQGSAPTQAYKDFRDIERSRAVMAHQIKDAYGDLFAASEYADRLGKDELLSKLRTVTGASADDEVIPSVAGTFQNLCRLADFESKLPSKTTGPTEPQQRSDNRSLPGGADYSRRLGISYTINLNLPATTEIEVFNSIFKALKEHILHE
jgi:Family of unknown function (DUF5343)